jgi:hypothetical protein
MYTDEDTAWELRREANLRRRELRQQAVDYLGGKCEICGYTGFPSAFDFHHPDVRTKSFNISDRLASLEHLKEELDKCALLCSRCHREVHEGLHPRYLITVDDSSEVDFSPPDDGFSYEEDVTFESVLEDAVKFIDTEVPVRRSRRRVRH